MGVTAMFGGIRCHSAEMSLSLGVSPDVGTLVFPATDAGRIPKTGSLVLRDGRGGSVTITHVYALEGTLEEMPGTKEISVQVADLRLLWKWASVRGVYNEPNADGTENQEVDTQGLIEACLTALPNIASSWLECPSGIYLPVRWQRESAAAALQALCDATALGVALAPDGRVYVSPLYAGGPALPGGGVTARQTTQTAAVTPAAIRIVGAPVVDEETFSLEAVGVEIDGTVRAVDNLSYTPSHGWATEPLTFPNIAAGTYNSIAYTADEARELATRSVWRWYSCGFTAAQRKRYLPFLPALARTDTIDGVEGRGEPWVLASYGHFDGTIWQKVAKTYIAEGWTLDSANGIVKFLRPLFDVQTDGEKATRLAEPDIELRAAFERWDTANSCRELYEYSHTLAGGVSGTELVHKAAELREYRIGSSSQNGTHLNTYAAKVAVRLAQEFSRAGPAARVYPRIVNQTPRGTLRAVRWSVSPTGGASTRIEQNFDTPPPWMPSYDEQRRRRRAENNAAEVRSWEAEFYAARTAGLMTHGAGGGGVH